MFSRKFFARCALHFFVPLFVLTGCFSKVGEAPPPQTGQEFSGTQCLSKTKPVAKAFIKGDVSTSELEAAWNCVGSAVDKFNRYVQGRQADRYTTQEIATFLEKNFLELKPDEKITPELQREFMKFKQMLIGGSSEYVTRAELSQARALIEEFSDLSVRLRPYMRVISLNWSVSDSDNLKDDMVHFEKASVELQGAAKTLAGIIKRNQMNYVLSDFSIFMEELAKFFKEEWKINSSLVKYMPVVKKVKKALAGGDENVITSEEWNPFLLLGARGYVLYLRYHYFIASTPETGTGYRLAYLTRTVEDIFSVFYDLVGEKPEGIVSRDEMTDILMTLSQAWPDFKMSPSLVFEGMKLKQLFFGGSVDSWTTTDFDTARLKVSRLRTLIERFLPYYGVYGMDWDPTLMEPAQAEQFFQESQFNLEATAREVGALLESSYSLDDLKSLLIELEQLYPSEDPENSLSKSVQKYLPLVVDGKNLILGGTDAGIRKNQWSVFLGFASRFYSDYLYYHYFLEQPKWDSVSVLSKASVFGNQTLNIVRDLIATKQDGPVTRADFARIVRRLIDLGMLPDGIKAESVDQIVAVLLNNVLVAPEERLAGRIPDGLTLTSIEVARRELQIWLDAQIFAADIFENHKDAYSAVELSARIKSALRKEMATEFFKISGKELLLALDSPTPMTVDGQGRVVISNHFEQGYDYNSLSRLNLNRAVSRLMIRSFSMGLDRINNYSGVTLPEVQGGFDSLKDIFIEMGLLEPSNLTFASSRFREANIFVPHSDGNQLASFTEITDLVGMIWSGLTINNLLREKLVRDCLGGSATDIPSSTLVSVECVKKSYRESMPEAMTSLPEYLKYMKRSSRDEWSNFMTNILKSAGYIPNSKQKAKLGDISLAPHVIQYSEMIFARFDRNKDNFISAAEAVKAFPSFKGIMMELADKDLKNGTIKEKDLLDVFTFILRYGRPPTSIKEKAQFLLFWKGKPEKWDVWTSRSLLAQILGYIADEVNKTGNGGGEGPQPQKPPNPPPRDR